MIMSDHQPPNDRRNFVHKKLFGAAKGFVKSGFNPLGAAAGFLGAGDTAPKREAQKQAGRGAKLGLAPGGGGFRGLGRTALDRFKRPGMATTLPFPIAAPRSFVSLPPLPGPDPCPIPFTCPDPVTGRCVPCLGEQVGRDDQPIGDAVMGRYGAGEVPGNMVVNRAVCRSGMVVADDGICYNKSQIMNSQRQWPRGRRPLLTGGDMRAISTAARAGARLERTTKRLQKIGLMKKPPPRRKLITSGPTDHHHHD